MSNIDARSSGQSRIIERWIRIGVLALPVYGVLTLASTLTHQPDPTSDFPAYARYISTTQFRVGHLVGSIGGTALAMLGIIALVGYLSRHGVVRPALAGLVLAVVGNSLILTLFGVAAFASPAIGKAYLAGQQDVVQVNEMIYAAPLAITGVLGSLCYTAGAIFLGVAIWRSRVLPRWSGVLVAAAVPLIALVGLVIGVAQTVGSVLLIAGSAWLVWEIWLEPATTVQQAEPPAETPIARPSDAP